MTVLPARFNIILAAVLLLGSGCRTNEQKMLDKQGAFLRFHLETNPDGTSHNFPVTVYRRDPVKIQVERDAKLDEGFIQKAELVSVDEFGNQAIKITFDETGTQRLNYVTASYKGRRLVALCKWTEDRALAAPLLNKTISNGVLIFTPDASREECERIVLGVNNVVRQVKKPFVF